MLLKKSPMFEIATGFVFKHSRHCSRATCHAYRRRRIVIVEDHPFASQLIEVGCSDVWVSVTSHRVGRLIVRHQENDVGPIAADRNEIGQNSNRKHYAKNTC